MSIEFVKPQAVKQEEGAPERLEKKDLVGAVVVFTTKAYNPHAETSFSADTHEWHGSILVVDGPFAGREEKDSRQWGNIARDLGLLPAGSTGVGRVTTGKSATKGRGNWFGVDWEVSDEDVAAAKAAVDGPGF